MSAASAGSADMGYPCGPLDVCIVSDPIGAETCLRGALDLFTAPWLGPRTRLEIALDRPGLPAAGGPDYLHTARMRVRSFARGVAAHCESGATACSDDIASMRWTIGVPAGGPDIWTMTDLENLVSLVLSTAWRALGWTPFHAGLVLRPGGAAALLCAPSGGGKTTLTLAFLRHGWTTLGDDKLLLRANHGSVAAHALCHSFNLFPHSADWFPEIGDLAELPHYSAWTDKRRVPAASLYGCVPAEIANPTHVVEVARNGVAGDFAVQPLAPPEILSLLMRQTVIPRDPAVAARILACVAALANQITGVRARIGQDAYTHPHSLDPLVAMLEAPR